MPAWIQELDELVLRWIAEHLRGPLLDRLAVFYTSLGNAGLIFLVAAVILLIGKRTRFAGCAALGAMGIGLVEVNLIIKPLVNRPRPYVVMENFTALLTSLDGYSFPSGHTNAAFAFAAALCLALPKECRWGKRVALAAAVLMGMSRLYVGVHFPSDVLGGVITGTVAGAAGYWLMKKLSGRFRILPQDLR